jgi:ABC-2 type transport system ATP-binding protein
MPEASEASISKFFSGLLEIARGLLHLPKIIFLDEPTLGLDPQTRNHMWEYLGG